MNNNQKTYFISQKIEIYPDESIKDILTLNFNYARYLYNLGIEWRSKLEEESFNAVGKKIILNPMDFMYFFQSREREWRDFENNQKIIGSLRTTVGKQLYEAYHNFLRNPKHFRPPKFKSKKRCQNLFTIPIVRKPNRNDTVRIENDRIIFPKSTTGGKYPKPYGVCYVSEQIRFQKGKPINATFSEDNGKYYVSFTFEYNQSPKVKTESSITIGIDLGIKNLITGITSNNEKIIVENQNKKLIHLFEKIKILSSQMTRSLEQNNYIKTKNYIRLHRKFRSTWRRVVNIRKDIMHKLTTYLTRTFGIIKIEDLYVCDMFHKKHRSLNRAISHSMFGLFRTMIEYKCQLRGVTLQLVDKYYPSSQICSSCGFRQKMPLSKRIYECPHCHVKLDRDINAATNILKETSQIKTIV